MNALHLSKSKYCALWQCPKLAWLKKYKPELQIIDEATLAIMKTGSEVGDLAMGLFGDFVEVTAYDGEKLDLTKMIEATKAEMDRGTPIICEASFSYNGLYCAVDILKRRTAAGRYTRSRAPLTVSGRSMPQMSRFRSTCWSTAEST